MLCVMILSWTANTFPSREPLHKSFSPWLYFLLIANINPSVQTRVCDLAEEILTPFSKRIFSSFDWHLKTSILKMHSMWHIIFMTKCKMGIRMQSTSAFTNGQCNECWPLVVDWSVHKLTAVLRSPSDCLAWSYVSLCTLRRTYLSN